MTHNKKKKYIYDYRRQKYINTFLQFIYRDVFNKYFTPFTHLFLNALQK